MYVHVNAGIALIKKLLEKRTQKLKDSFMTIGKTFHRLPSLKKKILVKQQVLLLLKSSRVQKP